MGIQLCTDQGVGPFWGPERGYNREIWSIWKKNSSGKTTDPNALIFDMKHP